MADMIATGRKGAQYFETKDQGEAMVVTAWHRKGHTIAREGATVEGALDTIEGNYEVEVRPTYRMKYENGEPTGVIECETAFVTVRADTDAELGSVGKGYNALQNREAFISIQPLIDDGILTLETGGVLHDGGMLWMMGRFETAQFGPVVQEVFGDELRPFGLWTNDHRGKRAASVANVTQRVVCKNTHRMADREMQASKKFVKVYHKGDVAENMVEASHKMFGGLKHRFEIAAAHYLRMKKATLTEAQFGKMVLDTIVPAREIDAKDEKSTRVQNLLAKDQTKRTEIRRLWDEGDGHSGDHSAWEAFNAATQTIDHNETMFRSGNRVQSLLEGQLCKMKDSILDKILDEVSVPNALLENIIRHHEGPTASLLDQILAANSN